MTAGITNRQAWAFFLITWASWCLLQRQWSRNYDNKYQLSGFIRLPMEWICISLILDNLRLFFGASIGKEGASLWLAEVCQFLRVIGRALSLSVLAAMLGFLVDLPWLRYLGGSAAMFYGMNGINYYVAGVHGRLVYKDDGDVPRYTLDKGTKVEPPALPLPSSVIAAATLLVTFVGMTTTGDVILLLMQVISIVGHVLMTSFCEYRLVYASLFRFLSVASLLRTERYI